MFQSVDTLSRSITLEASQTASRVAVFSQLQAWRLVVTSETPATIKLDISQANTQRTMTIDVPPFQSAVDYYGYGNCVVSVSNLSDSQASLIQISFEEPIRETQYQIESDPLAISDLSWTDVSPNQGYLPSFCNYASLYASGTFRYRLVDINGDVVHNGSFTNPSVQRDIQELRIPAHTKLQVRNETAGTEVQFKIVWFKKV